ncbi:MAG: TolC family protein [Rhodobacteraceae bacterium]|nr:TolC family protein [Paracoccaceae bacterium]
MLGFGLAGCMEMPSFGAKHGPETTEVSRQSSSMTQPAGEQQSDIIAALLARVSLLQAGSSYDTVARAALDASARASEAELRSAKLRAEAKSKNWLPTLGPSVSLTSLGDVVAGILLEQVLFDNGRRKAERAFAAADVEVAAVNLSVDMNTRVESAVSLYIAGLRGDEKAALNDRALKRMLEFKRIVDGRVAGGVSDRSDQRVVDAKINDIRAAMTTALEAAAAARAELKAMTGDGFGTLPEHMTMGKPPAGLRHLSVLLAEAEGGRSVAQARIDRAGLLPSLSAAANVTNGGTTGGLNVSSDQPFGFGTPAMLKAIEAARETAGRHVAEAEEDARRSVSRQEQRLASYRRQETEAADLARSSRETFRLFQAQFKAGQRSVMDVISVYEQLVQREQAHVDAKYEVILIQLEMARDLGLLADGDRI